MHIKSGNLSTNSNNKFSNGSRNLIQLVFSKYMWIISRAAVYLVAFNKELVPEDSFQLSENVNSMKDFDSHRPFFSS